MTKLSINFSCFWKLGFVKQKNKLTHNKHIKQLNAKHLLISEYEINNSEILFINTKLIFVLHDTPLQQNFHHLE